VPGDVAIPIVKSMGQGLSSNIQPLLLGSVDSAPMTMAEPPNGQASPEILGVPTGACPSSVSVPELIWTLPGPNSGNATRLHLIAEQDCSSSSTTTTTTSPGNFTTRTRTDIVGGVAARFRARATNPPFALIPEDTTLAPRWEVHTQDPNALGKTRTTIRPTLTDVDPGTYSVEVRVDSFDAEVAGHLHAPVETFAFGTFSLSTPAAGVKPTAECDIEVDFTRNGSCELTFEAGETSGVAMFVGEASLGSVSREATTQLRVEIPGLVDLHGLLDPNAVGYLRFPDPDPKHSNAVAFFATPSAAAGARVMVEHHVQLTKDPVLHPEGLALLLNDCSLPLGGIFDMDANWLIPHRTHRHGRSIDVNRSVLDRRTLPNLTGTILGNRAVIERACRSAGGTIYRERTIHCEF
jgi:hypothetical protein